MRPLGLLLFFALLFVGGVHARDLTIATYNVHNYNETDRMTEGGYEMKAPKPEDEKAALRKAIRAMNADVVVMQEMGPEPFLRELQRDLMREGTDYPFFGLVDGPDPDRHVAFLSRVKPEAVVTHASVATRWRQSGRLRRGLLELRLPFGGSTLTIYAMHLKSQRTSDPSDPESRQERAKEAEAVRDLVLKAHDGEGYYLMAGDMNDTRRSRTLRALTQRGKRIVAQRVEARDSDGMVWTHRYSREGVYSNFDYILVSPALQPLVAGGQAQILDIPDVKDASDHRPVFVTLKAPTGTKPVSKKAAGQRPAGSFDDGDDGVPEVAPARDDPPED